MAPFFRVSAASFVKIQNKNQEASQAAQTSNTTLFLLYICFVAKKEYL